MKRTLSFVAAALVVLAVSGCSAERDGPTSSPSPEVTESAPAAQLEELFALPEDPAAAAAEAGLPVLEGPPPAAASRTHVDLVIDGYQVPVPAGIGVSEDGSAYSPLHTRAADGIVYTSEPATLGQLLTAWGVPFDGPCIGEVCVDNMERLLLVYKDGKAVGDPANLPLADGSQVFIWVGSADSVPPVISTYQFPS